MYSTYYAIEGHFEVVLENGKEKKKWKFSRVITGLVINKTDRTVILTKCKIRDHYRRREFCLYMIEDE